MVYLLFLAVVVSATATVTGVMVLLLAAGLDDGSLHATVILVVAVALLLVVAFRAIRVVQVTDRGRLFLLLDRKLPLRQLIHGVECRWCIAHPRVIDLLLHLLADELLAP